VVARELGEAEADVVRSAMGALRVAVDAAEAAARQRHDEVLTAVASLGQRHAENFEALKVIVMGLGGRVPDDGVMLVQLFGQEVARQLAEFRTAQQARDAATSAPAVAPAPPARGGAVAASKPCFNVGVDLKHTKHGVLGKGGSSVVYRCVLETATMKKRLVALKAFVAEAAISPVAAVHVGVDDVEVVDDHEEAREVSLTMRRELAVMERAGRHASLVNLVGTCQAPAGIVLEYCDRGALDRHLYTGGVGAYAATVRGRGALESRDGRSGGASRIGADDAAPQAMTALSLATRLQLAHDVIAGVEHLHACGIAHRDLKSPNVLLVSLAGGATVAGVEPLRAKIADFSISSVSRTFGGTSFTLSPAARGSTTTMAAAAAADPGAAAAVPSLAGAAPGSAAASAGAGALRARAAVEGALGTLRWAPPELSRSAPASGAGTAASDEMRRSRAVDIWSLGCVLGELVLCEMPFADRADDREVGLAILDGRKPYDDARVREVSPALAGLMAMCFDEDAQRRPAVEVVALHWSAVVRELAARTAGAPLPALPTALAGAARRMEEAAWRVAEADSRALSADERTRAPAERLCRLPSPEADRLNRVLAKAIEDLERGSLLDRALGREVRVTEPQLRAVLERYVVPGVTRVVLGAEWDYAAGGLTRSRKCGALLTDAHVQLISDRCGATLQALFVGGSSAGEPNGVLDASILALAARCPALVELGLGATRVSDVAVVEVATRCSALAWLDVGATRAGDGVLAWCGGIAGVAPAARGGVGVAEGVRGGRGGAVASAPWRGGGCVRAPRSRAGGRAEGAGGEEWSGERGAAARGAGAVRGAGRDEGGGGG